NHILELRLRQLTKFSRIELEAERDELRATIAELESILASDQKLRGVVSDELGEVAERYGTDRRTELADSDDLAALASAATDSGAASTKKGLGLALEIADDPCWVALSTSGQLGRTPGGPRGR